MRLEDLQIGTRFRGLTAEGVATVKAVTWFGDQAVEVVFKALARRARRGKVSP